MEGKEANSFVWLDEKNGEKGKVEGIGFLPGPPFHFLPNWEENMREERIFIVGPV